MDFIVQYNRRAIKLIGPIGPDTHCNLHETLYQSGLSMPSFGLLTALVLASYTRTIPASHVREVEKVLANDDSYLVGCTRTLWTKDGFYAYEDFRDEILGEDYLKGRLSSKEKRGVVYSKDSAIRFAPNGRKEFVFSNSNYWFPMQTREFANSSILRAMAGDDGVRNLVEVSRRCLKKRLYGFDAHELKEPTKGFAALDTSRGGDRLRIYSSFEDNSTFYVTFGISEKQ